MTGEFLDKPPDGPSITDYDRSHMKLYLRLLDADADHADWREVVPILFGFEVDTDPRRAEGIHAAHLARARWMTANAPAELERFAPR